MSYNEDAWNEIILKVSKHFKVTADFDFILFVIGVQERGTGFKEYTREEKWDMINLAKCKLFARKGYLKETGHDSENWPTFEEVKKMRTLSPSLNQRILKEAIIEYFENAWN
ncbi:MAG: hypothetical protein GX879_11470 [Bacteroidales bacterium]|nr:hypothetical protein [Bacteroidales bacterium]